ncbi:S8 family serine peptidase [Streptomyces sp. NPDC001970]
MSRRRRARLTGRPPAAPSLPGGIDKIWLDGKVNAALADSTAQIGAPQVWDEGAIGTGVKVAVLDTGVDAGHPDLEKRIVSSRSFVPGEDVTDRRGHGTHVASTIAGRGRRCHRRRRRCRRCRRRRRRRGCRGGGAPGAPSAVASGPGPGGPFREAVAG